MNTKCISAICCGFVVIVVVSVVITAMVTGIAVQNLGPWVYQCQLGYGDSLHVQVDSVKLTTAPTDNVLFGWEFLFGKPADEISVNLQSDICVNRNHPQAIQEGDTIEFGSSLTINTYYRNGFSFRLEEDDSWFEGADDYSQKIEVPSKQLDSIRQIFDNGAADNIELDYAVVVEGKNIFQENTWFGFIAENLCVSVVDFVWGPYGSKALGRLTKVFNSGDISSIYRKVSRAYMSGTVKKSNIFKSVATYQLREGAKMAVLNPLKKRFNILKENAIEDISEWALDQTLLDEKLREAVTVLKDDGVYTETDDEKGMGIYSEINEELTQWSEYLATLTDSLEFCLADVWPPSRDAVYHVKITVTR